MKLGDRKLKATAGFVFVESKEQEYSETKTASGIIIPHKERHNIWVKGTIYSAGKYLDHVTKQVHEAPVKEGDLIMYRKYETEKIQFDDITLYRLPYERVRFVMEE